MGTGASSQIRSRSESTNDVHFLTDQGFKQMPNERLFCTTTKIAAIHESDTIADPNPKITESHKTSWRSEIRSQNSCDGIRKDSQAVTKTDVQYLPNHELHQKIQELQLALAASESQVLDLQDQVQALEERSSNAAEKTLPLVTDITDIFQKSVDAKDQQIKQLEEDLKSLKVDFQIKTLKWKKRVRGLTNKIFELRQEASITRMELKANMAQQNDQMVSLLSTEKKELSDERCSSSCSHSKVIVELSSQIAEQENQIAKLTAEARQKEQRISELEAALREASEAAATVCTDQTSLHSEDFSNNDTVRSDWAVHGRRKNHPHNSARHDLPLSSSHHDRNGISENNNSSRTSLAGSHQRSLFQYCSTALSDSDSDWEDEPPHSHAHVHSAPPHIRVRSDMSTSRSRIS